MSNWNTSNSFTVHFTIVNITYFFMSNIHISAYNNWFLLVQFSNIFLKRSVPRQTFWQRYKFTTSIGDICKKREYEISLKV